MSLRDTAQVQSKVIELQQAILNAQSGALDAKTEQGDLLDRLRKAEAELAALQSWDEERSRYSLRDYGNQTFAYELIPAKAHEGEPSHRLCPRCFEARKKSILQFQYENFGVKYFRCLECSSEVPLGVRQPWPEQRAIGIDYDPLG